MKILFFLKDTFKKTSGVVLIVLGIIMLLVAVFGIFTYYDMPKSEAVAVIIIYLVLGAICVIPGIRLYRSGQKQSDFEKKLEQFASLMKEYRRMSIPDISRNLGISDMETREVINTAISLDMVRGHMDRNTDEFFTDDSISDVRKISACPNCGAKIEQILHEGETAKCGSCGSVFR